MAPVQATLFFYLFFLAVLARSHHVLFIDQSDTNSVRFSGDWPTTSYPTAIGGSYAFTAEPAARVSIVLPRGAVAVRYFGLQPQTPTIYDYCVDCVTADASDDPIDVTSVQVNGTFLNTDEEASPLSLFTIADLDPAVSHVLTVLNPRPKNVITIDGVAVDVLDDVTVTPPSDTSTISTSPSTPLQTPSGTSSEPSWTPTPTPPPAAVFDLPASTGHPSATPTFPPPSTTSQGSGSSGTDKSASPPLIIALTVASTVILVVIFIIHRHVRRYRRDNTALGSDKSSRDPGPDGPPMVVVRGRPLGTESNVLPASTLWRTITPNAASLFGRFGAVRNPRSDPNRNIPTPSMMETLQSHTNFSGTVQSNDSGGRSQPANEMA